MKGLSSRMSSHSNMFGLVIQLEIACSKQLSILSNLLCAGACCHFIFFLGGYACRAM